jgi:DNA helicase-2/ATP-dependent DNA helicase PcrA
MVKHKIYGPPGTGKTTRLIELLAQEIENGIPTQRIAFLTFTKAARIEALSRTEKKESDFPYLRTIHSICYRQLGISRDQIVATHELQTFGRFMSIPLRGGIADPWVEEFERNWVAPTREDLLLQINHSGRHRGLLLKESLKEANCDIDYKYAVWFTKAYRAWKETRGLVDYTDLLMKYLDFGKPLDVDVLFVDEAQDLSPLQWEVIDKLSAKAKKMYICGDDDQAIFKWAGADSSSFQNYATDTEEILHQSYRISKAVHEVAMRLASKIKVRVPKDYLPTSSEGEVITVDNLQSADFSKKTFVLFRNNYRGDVLSSALNGMGVPYIGKGSPLSDYRVREALYCWYKLIKNGEITREECRKLLRYANKDYTFYDYRRLPNKAIFTLSEVFANPPKWMWWKEYLSKLPDKHIIEHFIKVSGFLRTARPKVELMSMHQSKGREAHTVIIDKEISKAVYDSTLHDSDDEYRVFYVAVTRAKERIIFVMAEGNYEFGI